jgi:hypothetical protein
VADPEGGGEREREREREREKESSILLLRHISIHSFIRLLNVINHYIFSRCTALLVFLITFELLRQSTINQKTK